MNVLFHSISYDKLLKRNNSIVQITLGTFVEIIGIFCVTTAMGIKKYIILGKCFETLQDILCKNGDVSSTLYCYSVRITNTVTALLNISFIHY